MRLKLTISYDGTHYAGWQIQKNAVTIQQIIEEACQKLFSQEIKVTGASRTDAGVHALGQIATIDVDTSIKAEQLPYALNAHLPNDIVIRSTRVMPANFHPRYQAVSKTYNYRIFNDCFPDPLTKHFMYFYHKKLDVEAMKKAASCFVGEYDFKAFCSTGSSVNSTVREVYHCQVDQDNKTITLRINGNGFLYNMVRIIAGTLIDVGLGKINPNSIASIIRSKDRNQAGPTAPALGLCLEAIQYSKS